MQHGCKSGDVCKLQKYLQTTPYLCRVSFQYLFKARSLYVAYRPHMVKGENGKTIVEGASFNLQSAARRWMVGKFLPISFFFNGVRPKQFFKAMHVMDCVGNACWQCMLWIALAGAHKDTQRYTNILRALVCKVYYMV